MNKNNEPTKNFKIYKLKNNNNFFFDKKKLSEEGKLKLITYKESDKRETEDYQILNVSIFIKKVEDEINTGLGWLLKEIYLKNNEELRNWEEFEKNDVAYGIYIKLSNGSILEEFAIVFRGKVDINMDDIDTEYFHKLSNEIKIDNITGQSIINPNAEISKKTNILKGNGSDPISDIGDFFESVKMKVSKDESIFNLDPYSRTIEIKETLNSSFSKNSTLDQMINYTINLSKIHFRESNSKKFLFVKRVKSDKLILSLWKEIVNMAKENKIDETIIHTYKEKVVDDYGEYKIKAPIKKRGFDSLDIDSYKGFRLNYNIVRIFLNDLSKMKEWKNNPDLVIKKFIFEASLSIEVNATKKVKGILIKKYLDIWDVTIENKSYYLIAGEWYVNDNEFDIILGDYIKEQEAQKHIVYNELSGSSLTNYGKDWKEDDYNKQQAITSPSNTYNIDKKLKQTSLGRFEIADLIKIEEGTITFYAVKQSPLYISSTKYVFEQAILAINYLKTSGILLKFKEKYGNDFIFKYEVIIFHKQKNVKTIINDVKSFAYKKLASDFIMICQKNTINPKIRFIKKETIEIDSTENINKNFLTTMEEQKDFFLWFDKEIRPK